jgi:uncharacterized protein with HEPN domain
MTDRVRIRLNDILVAIERIEGIIQGLSLADYRENFEKQWLVERGVEIISEASRHVPLDMTDQYPNLRWHDVRQIGNRLRHEYDRVDATIMWSIATEHLSEMKPVIVLLIAGLEKKSTT